MGPPREGGEEANSLDSILIPLCSMKLAEARHEESISPPSTVVVKPSGIRLWPNFMIYSLYVNL